MAGSRGRLSSEQRTGGGLVGGQAHSTLKQALLLGWWLVLLLSRSDASGGSCGSLGGITTLRRLMTRHALRVHVDRSGRVAQGRLRYDLWLRCAREELGKHQLFGPPTACPFRHLCLRRLRLHFLFLVGRERTSCSCTLACTILSLRWSIFRTVPLLQKVVRAQLSRPFLRWLLLPTRPKLISLGGLGGRLHLF